MYLSQNILMQHMVDLLSNLEKYDNYCPVMNLSKQQVINDKSDLQLAYKCTPQENRLVLNCL